MKILVTGANGYLGKGIVTQLLNDGFEVVGSDIKFEDYDERLTIKSGDLFAIEDPYSYFGKPDVLLHLAWRDGFVHSSEKHIEDLPKHFKFIERMVDGGIKKVAVMGTMHEIGKFDGCVTDCTPCNPTNYYGISKNALRCFVEQLCALKNVAFQWLRAYYIVGNYCFGNSVFSKIYSAEKMGEKYFPFTSGEQEYDFLTYNDFCMYVASAVEQEEIKGIINICSGYPQKISDKVEEFIRTNGLSIKLDYGKYPDRPYDSRMIWGDANKIHTIMDRRKRI